MVASGQQLQTEPFHPIVTGELNSTNDHMYLETVSSKSDVFKAHIIANLRWRTKPAFRWGLREGPIWYQNLHVRPARMKTKRLQMKSELGGESYFIASQGVTSSHNKVLTKWDRDTKTLRPTQRSCWTWKGLESSALLYEKQRPLLILIGRSLKRK